MDVRILKEDNNDNDNDVFSSLFWGWVGGGDGITEAAFTPRQEQDRDGVGEEGQSSPSARWCTTVTTCCYPLSAPQTTVLYMMLLALLVLLYGQTQTVMSCKVRHGAPGWPCVVLLVLCCLFVLSSVFMALKNHEHLIPARACYGIQLLLEHFITEPLVFVQRNDITSMIHSGFLVMCSQ